MKTKRFEQKSRVKVQVRNCSLLFNVASSLALLTGHRLSMASMGGGIIPPSTLLEKKRLVLSMLDMKIQETFQ